MNQKNKDLLKEVGKFVSRKIAEQSPYTVTDVAYKSFFYHHTYTGNASKFDNDLFPELIPERVTFKSLENYLVGYFYHYKEYDPSKIIIFVHGYGNGHHRYLDVINYLAKSKFLVFSYDATSFDESSGEGILGFPQGLIDLDNAINFVKESKGYKEEDMILIGHSWGAFSSGAILNLHKNISKVILMAGFNKSADIIKSTGLEWGGEIVEKNVEYVEEYEEYRFGTYASLTVLDGLKNSTTKAFIIHSLDDNTVPIKLGLNLYKENLKDNERIIYKIFEDRGHGTVYDSLVGKEYFISKRKEYAKYTKDKKLSLEDKKYCFNLIVDKSKWSDLLNYSLMDEIVNFINEF